MRHLRSFCPKNRNLNFNTMNDVARTRNFILLLTLLLIIVTVAVLLCWGETQVSADFCVTVPSGSREEKILLWTDENCEYFVFMPSYAELSQAQISLQTEKPIYVDGRLLTDGMSCDVFQAGTSYELTFEWRNETQHSCITFVQSGNVAALFVDTQSGRMDYIHSEKGNEESGALRLYREDGRTDFAGDISAINGRGNGTWNNYEKKAYSITLSEEADLLEMGSAQKWILLANAGDTSNLRNKMIFDFADAVGLAYSPESEWVDVYLNGEYAGLYLLCERNEVDSERVDIAADDSFLVSMEPEARLFSQQYAHVVTEAGQALRIHYEGDNAYVLQTVQSVENAIMAENGTDPVSGRSYQDLIDLDSWCRKYLIEEIFGNYDAGANSQYYYSDGTRVYAGPVWDYDTTMGNNTAWQLADPKTLLADRLVVSESAQTPWLYYLCRKNDFRDRVLTLYLTESQELLQQLLEEDIYTYVQEIAQASAMNQIRWDIENTCEAEAEYIVQYMTERRNFLESIWLQGTDYAWVRIDSGVGANYGYFAVIPGEPLETVPVLESTGDAKFLGWYYADTGEPFDITQPIREDTELCAKWESTSQDQLEDVLKLAPLGCITLLFFAVLVVDIKRRKH